jgi:hypothetical protein
MNSHCDSRAGASTLDAMRLAGLIYDGELALIHDMRKNPS